MSDEVYNQIVTAAASYGASDIENYIPLQLLCGAAKLISCKDTVIKAIFKNEDDQAKIEDLREIFVKNEIDASLLKKVGYNLCRVDRSDRAVQDCKKIIASCNGDSVGLIKAILENNIPGLDCVKNGKNPEDVFAFIREQEEKNEPADDSKEKPEESAETEENNVQSKECDVQAENESTQAENDKIQPEEADTCVNTSGSFSSLMKKTMRLYSELQANIFGQNEAVLTFSRGYFESEILHEKEVKEKAKPAGVFMFAGPPGVGKTYLAEIAAKSLGRKCLRLDMAEYADSQSIDDLIGIPDFYRGSRSGKLTEYVKKNPTAILIFDELEKCSQSVKNLLLEILDGGRATDVYTKKVVDFRNTLIIFTSNAGKSLYESHDRTNLATLPASVIVKAMSEEKNVFGQPLISDALLSRFRSSNLIMFNYLGAHELVDIIHKNFNQCLSWVKDLFQMEIAIDKEVAPLLLFTQSNNTDARNISSKSTMMIKDEIFELERHLDDSSKMDQIKKIHLSVDLSNADDEIKTLFKNYDKSDILYIGDQKDISNIPLGEKVICHSAGDAETVKKVLAEENISLIIADLGYGASSARSEFLSLDDAGTKGIYLFQMVHEKMPDLDIYILEKDEIKESDKMNFFENGAKGFIRYSSDIELADRINSLCDDIYMQKQVDYLSGRSRVLTYNSSQKITNDGTVAEISFYDLREKIVTDSEENRAILSEADKPKDKFDDVIGAENAKKELRYFIDYLKNPKAFMKKRHVKIPKGILLYGPPGTGKTMLARAMAGEADVTFVPTSAAEFKNKYVGESEKNVRKLFATARKFAPSILFIDEIDSVGLTRSGGEFSHSSEGILNQLLTEMDGFEVNLEKPVFVIAATNANVDGHGRSLDPALVRRFDKPIKVDLPNEEERKKFLRMMLEREGITSISDDAIDSVAILTTGLSLAIIKNVLDSAIRTADENGKKLDKDIFVNALDDYMHGEKREWSKEYYRSVAIHESGHAYLSVLADDIPSLVTIVSRGYYGGYMAPGSHEDKPNYSKNDILNDIRTDLAGRAAEVEFYGEDAGTNTGVSTDLEHATSSAMNLICRFGMTSDNMVSLNYGQVLMSPLAEKLVEDANKLIKEQYDITLEKVKEGHDKIKALADFLMENNQATGEDVKRIFGLTEK